MPESTKGALSPTMKLTLPLVVNEGEDLIEMCHAIFVRYGLIGYRVTDPKGTSGGWPDVEFEGFVDRVAKLASDYENDTVYGDTLFDPPTF